MERPYYGAPLCHKEPAKVPSRGLWMPELVLYGIRELKPDLILDMEVENSD